MAFENFWKRDRDRSSGDRTRDDWRSRASEWREAIQGGRGQRDYSRGSYGSGEDKDFEQRGWRQGSDYYGDRDERYGPRGGQRWQGSYGSEDRDDFPSGNWRDDRMSYGESSGGGFGRDYGGRGYEADYARRGSGGYGGGSYGRDSNDDATGGAYGTGGYGRDLDYGRRGALGYGGYGGMGGAETGSSVYGRMGESQEQHRGRGPRGYRRSDERIRDDICDMLTEDPYIDASNMEVTVKDCEVTLSGSVSSREDKRRAEDLAERVSGVKDVHNTLRVSAQDRTSGTESVTQGTAQAAQTNQTGAAGPARH